MMNSPNNNPQFDEHDRLIHQALHQSPSVPPGAKNRVRQQLALASWDSTMESSSVALATVSADGSKVATGPESLTGAFRGQLAQATHWVVMHRRLASSLLVAASLLLATGFYILTRPLDRKQLVVACSQFLDESLDHQLDWTSRDPGELRDWLRNIGLRQLPRTIQLLGLNEAPLGSSGQLWRLSFDGRKDLYIVEFHQSVTVEGVGGRVQLLQTSSNNWSVAAAQPDGRLVVFMTKGRLEQYLQLVPLA